MGGEAKKTPNYIHNCSHVRLGVPEDHSQYQKGVHKIRCSVGIQERGRRKMPGCRFSQVHRVPAHSAPAQEASCPAGRWHAVVTRTMQHQPRRTWSGISEKERVLKKGGWWRGADACNSDMVNRVARGAQQCSTWRIHHRPAVMC